MTRLQVNLDAAARAKADQAWREWEVATQAVARRALWRGVRWALCFLAIGVLVVWVMLIAIF